MVLKNKDKILIKNVYLFKKYSFRKLIKKFSEKVKTENFKLFPEEAA